MKKLVWIGLIAILVAGFGVATYPLYLAFGPPELVARDRIRFAETLADIVIRDGKCEVESVLRETDLDAYYHILKSRGWSLEDMDRMGGTVRAETDKLRIVIPFGFDERFYFDVCSDCWQIADNRITTLRRCRVFPTDQ